MGRPQRRPGFWGRMREHFNPLGGQPKGALGRRVMDEARRRAEDPEQFRSLRNWDARQKELARLGRSGPGEREAHGIIGFLNRIIGKLFGIFGFADRIGEGRRRGFTGEGAARAKELTEERWRRRQEHVTGRPAEQRQQ